MLKDIVEVTPLGRSPVPLSLAYLISLCYLVFLCDKSNQPAPRRARLASRYAPTLARA